MYIECCHNVQTNCYRSFAKYSVVHSLVVRTSMHYIQVRDRWLLYTICWCRLHAAYDMLWCTLPLAGCADVGPGVLEIPQWDNICCVSRRWLLATVNILNNLCQCVNCAVRSCSNRPLCQLQNSTSLSYKCCLWPVFKQYVIYYTPIK